MVVIGNPPYSVSSLNKGKWITNLIQEYKKNLNEKNIQPLSDDYIKFIRYAEYFIEKNGTGIVAMITNNTFLDGIIHRQMRKHLLETFDEIYIIDLHGSTKKKEIAPDGSKDENVFDIQQGVTISIMIRKSIKKEKMGNIKFFELYGTRSKKFSILKNSELEKIQWNELKISAPNYFFIKKDFNSLIEYNSGIKLTDLFIHFGTGIKTNRDNLLVDFNAELLLNKIEIIKNTDNIQEINQLLKIKEGKYWDTKREKE